LSKDWANKGTKQQLWAWGWGIQTERGAIRCNKQGETVDSVVLGLQDPQRDRNSAVELIDIFLNKQNDSYQR
jgi:hypothetical protein